MSAATPCTTAWEEVGLSNLRPSLDEQALAIAENQESSLESRRALAAQAKSFRLSVEAEVGATSDMRAASGALVSAGVYFLSFYALARTRTEYLCPRLEPISGVYCAAPRLLRLRCTDRCDGMYVVRRGGCKPQSACLFGHEYFEAPALAHVG